MPIVDAVAVLTKTVGIEWDVNSAFRPELGQTLEPCNLSISKGLAQVEFLQGSTAILEGPVEFKVNNPNEGSLHKLGQVCHRLPVGLPYTCLKEN